jgi:hypothetical protein
VGERRHFTALLNGKDAQGDQERALSAQAESNAHQLERVIELDRRLNQKITHEKSYYR